LPPPVAVIEEKVELPPLEPTAPDTAAPPFPTVST
jgi:hypothetical protein